MFRSFGNKSGVVQINYMIEDLGMDPTHNIGTFLHLLKYFLGVQLLYPNIREKEKVGCLFSDISKKQILWNYTLDVFEDGIYNIYKNCYINIHT